MPEWLTPWLSPASVAGACYFLWRLERRVFCIEVYLKLPNGKAPP